MGIKIEVTITETKSDDSQQGKASPKTPSWPCNRCHGRGYYYDYFDRACDTPIDCSHEGGFTNVVGFHSFSS